MKELLRQVNKDEIHPKHVFTPSQAALFMGCRPCDVKNKIQPVWWDGNVPKFIGEAILEYQERRRRETQAVYDSHKNILQNIR